MEFEAAPELRIEGSCPECAGPWRAELWDHSFSCEYCGSTLVSSRPRGDELYVVVDGRSEPDLIGDLIWNELEQLRAKLTGRAHPEGSLTLELPGWVEARVAALEAELRRKLELVEAIDFFAPYELRERVNLQGILGRRREIKESFVRVFASEELRRLYDANAYNLRDRGLKIRALRLAPLRDTHLALCDGRLLPRVETRDELPDFDRSTMNIAPGTRVICKMTEAGRERRLSVYKHLTYVQVRRAGAREDYLVDRQFGGIAGRLSADEAETYRELGANPLEGLPPKAEVRAIASQCPNCGWELELPHRERICFCPTCASAVEVSAQGLSLSSYVCGETPAAGDGDALVYVPFWVFPFRVHAQGREFRRVWDWLEQISPQPIAREFVETDPDESALFVPARELFGTPDLDDAFAQLVGWVNWRQPRLLPDRPQPDRRARMLGVELEPAELDGLAHFSLLTLHDNQSTRRLNGRTFNEHIRDARVALAGPQLAAIPLAFRGDAWNPGARHLGSSVRGFSRSLLETDVARRRLSLSFSLR